VKYFICALDTLTLGIPAQQTERIIPVTRAQTNVTESENEEAFISVPVLFKQKEIPAPHGLVLKAGPVKTVLLTPRIDIDLEIPEESIRPLPQVFNGAFPFLKGVFFTGPGENMILVLNPEKLAESLQ